MRKDTFLFIVIAAMICSTVYAQVKIGVRSGMNYPRMSGENYFSQGLYKPKYIFKNDLYGHAGLVFEVQLLKFLSVQPEILYSQSGYSWYSPAQYGTYIFVNGTQTVEPDYTELLSFISVPLLLKIKLWKFAIVGGPQFDRLITAKRQEIAETDKVNVKDDYNITNTYSSTVGIEFNFKFGFGLSARYQKGFNNIAKPSPSGIYVEGNQIKNNLFMFSTHYLFGKSK